MVLVAASFYISPAVATVAADVLTNAFPMITVFANFKLVKQSLER